jgi:Ca2+-binding RTX toxin-like protein
VTLTFDSTANAALAKTLAGQITAGIFAGTIKPFTSNDGPPPALPPGTVGSFVQQSSGVALLSPGYRSFIGAASSMNVFGSGDANETILSGMGSLTFTALAGSGTVVAGGGGTSKILIGPGDPGNWSINTGGGDDRILALGAGNDSISAGGGNNQIQLGAGRSTVVSSGEDTILAGAGAATIIASAGAEDAIFGGAGKLFFVGGTGEATVFGGTGSTTILGGDGESVFHGGSDGHNLLIAGSGAATLFGAGDGDLLEAGGDHQKLIAGAGAETLNAVFGNQTTLVAGTGNSTMIGGFGKDVYEFVNGQAGGHVAVLDFTSGQKIDLDGYGHAEIANAVATQTHAGGATTITLSDHTTITFSGVASLTKGDFTS